jgi:hypothetical protein
MMARIPNLRELQLVPYILLLYDIYRPNVVSTLFIFVVLRILVEIGLLYWDMA